MRESRYAKQDTQKKARKRTMIDLTPSINAAILLVAALVTTFLVPWIKANPDEIEAVIESLVLGLKG